MINYLIGILVILISTLGIVLLIIGCNTFPREDLEEELVYYEPKEPLEKLYNITDKSIIDLTIVIPAYNEKLRLPNMLKDCLNYLKLRQERDETFDFELLIICDGSTDKTHDVALDFKKQNKLESHQLKVIRNLINRGKGGSVRKGMLHSKGKCILFADADGATQFSDLDHLELEFNKIEKEDLALVVGSRHHLKNSEAVIKRSFLRNFLMNGFHLYLHLLGIQHIQDTQCGFKLFSRKAAMKIFNNLHVEGWIFDIEILILASKFNIPVKEVMVNWTEIDGSKVNIVKDAFIMALDLLMIRLCYSVGIWKIKN